jgi:hypothetical protein
MEVSDVRRRVRDALAEAKKEAAERRSRRDAAAQAWTDALERVVLPVSRQIMHALKAEGFQMQISTPADRVRIASESRPQDYIELTLEADSDGEAGVVGRISQERGRETISMERVFVRGGSAIAAMSEEQVLEFLARALAGILVR